MMRTDDGRIDHLQRGVRHSASREPFQNHVPDATVGPPPKLPKDRVPVAEALRQVAPRCASSHQPKHRVEHAAMIAWRPAAAAMDQERFEVRPLIVGHQSANQGCPPQRAALNQFAILASIGLSTRPKAIAVAVECKWIKDTPYDKQHIVNDILRLECVRAEGRHVMRFLLVAGRKSEFDKNFRNMMVNVG